jgi:hypothetical protein
MIIKALIIIIIKKLAGVYNIIGVIHITFQYK